MNGEQPLIPEEEKRDKTIGGLSESCHRDFNTLKYRHGYSNADQLLKDMMAISEMTGLLTEDGKGLMKELDALGQNYESPVEMMDDLIYSKKKAGDD